MDIDQYKKAKNFFVVMLLIDMALTATVIINNLDSVQALKQVQLGIRQVDDRLFKDLEFGDDLGRLLFVTLLGVGISLSNWLKKSYRFARESLGAAGFAQEGWAVWGWVVPVVVLFKPYKVMKELYQAGGESYRASNEWQSEAVPGLLLGWWLFWLATHMFMWFAGKALLRDIVHDDLSLNQTISLYNVHTSILLLSLLVGVVWIFVAGKISDRLIKKQPLTVAEEFADAVVPAAPAFSKENPMVQSRTAFNSTPSSTEQKVSDSVVSVLSEEEIYAKIASELDTPGELDKALWIRLFAENNGDETQTKVQYIRVRVQKIKAMQS